ncbi:MAG TPA: hypothetical protein VHV82_13105 [Sporichthyaceae bacterium]|nr:hypothetical protein [Sporichthyaceae bacterium]
MIDAKRYEGPELRAEGGFLSPRVERLMVGGRDCTKLVDGVLDQVDLVRAVVGEVPVSGVLCFVEADWPLFGGSLTTRGVRAMWPKRLAQMLVAAPSGQVDVAATHRLLAKAFRVA